MVLKIYKHVCRDGKILRIKSGIAVPFQTRFGVRYHTGFLGWSGNFDTRREAWSFASKALKSKLLDIWRTVTHQYLD